MAPRSRLSQADPIGPAPARPRLLAWVRRSALAVLLALLGLAALASWVAGAVVGRRVIGRSDSDGEAMGDLVVALGLTQLVVFAGLGLLAYAVARRSTRVVEDVFRHEDRLMLAVAHEIRSPLARLLVRLDEGIDGTVPTELAVKEAAIDASTLSELIDDLMEAARVMSGAMVLPSEVVRVDEVVGAVARSHTRGDVRIVVEAPPTTLVGSPRLLRLAVSNLVRNSIRHAYGGRGGVVHIEVTADGVTVTDEGAGIPPERLDELRRDIPRGLRRARSGLGLALAGWVSDVHGGHLELANRAEGGLEAQLVVPVELREAVAEPAGEPPPAGP
ncbi:MAG TPA: ATP-binding protein [Acidimicrobiales bacterium]|nr:ATP-binding protein [Acidimicrobiales bacterium]